MTRLTFRWIIVQLKANLRSVSFYLMTLLIMVGFYLTGEVFKEYSEDFRVYACVNDSETGRAVMQHLMDSAPDGFAFDICEDENDIKDLIIKGDISCGIVFDASDKITVYQSSDTADGYVLEEILFPKLLRNDADKWLTDYLTAQYMIYDEGTDREAVEFVRENYNEYLNNVKIDIFELKEIAAINHQNEKDNNRQYRLLIDVLIILAVTVLCIIDFYRSDVGFYKCFCKGQGIVLKLEKVFITVIMSVAVAYVLSRGMRGIN